MQLSLRYRFSWIRGKRRDERVSAWPGALSFIASTALAFLLFAATAGANPPGATIEYQVMTSDGLAAGYPFECWVVFKISSDPSVQGLALPAGATLRFTFPQAFTPQLNNGPQAVLLHGWSQSPIAVPFTVGLDPQDPRTIVIKLSGDLPAGAPERPGLKAIHLRWGPLNASQAGDYPITIQVSDAGGVSGIPRPSPISRPNRCRMLQPTMNSTRAAMRIGSM